MPVVGVLVILTPLTLLLRNENCLIAPVVLSKCRPWIISFIASLKNRIRFPVLAGDGIQRLGVRQCPSEAPAYLIDHRGKPGRKKSPMQNRERCSIAQLDDQQGSADTGGFLGCAETIRAV